MRTHERLNRKRIGAIAACVAVAAAVAGCASSRDGFEPWADPDLGRAIVATRDAAGGGGGGAAAAPPIGDLSLQPDAEPEAYVRLALRRSPAIQAAAQRVAAAEARVTVARSLDDPELMVTPVGEMGATLDGMPTVMAGVTQSLPFPGKLSARAAAASAEAEVARSEWRAARLRVARDVRQAYWRHYNATRTLEVTRQGLDLLRQARDAAEASYRSGGTAQEDVLTAGMEASEWENEVLTLEAQARAAAGALNALLDRPLHAALPTPAAREPSETRAGLDALLSRAGRHNPGLVTMRRRIDAGRRDLRVAKLERWPDSSVGLQYNVVDEDEAMGPMLPPPSGDDEWWLTFGVSLPIWGGKYDAMEREARGELLARLADLRGESNRVAAELQAATVEADTQSRMVYLFRDTLLPQARQAREASLSSYRAGRATFGAVIEGTRRVLEYERMFHQAHAELGRMLAEIDELAGGEPAEPSEVSGSTEVRHE